MFNLKKKRDSIYPDMKKKHIIFVHIFKEHDHLN